MIKGKPVVRWSPAARRLLVEGIKVKKSERKGGRKPRETSNSRNIDSETRW